MLNEDAKMNLLKWFKARINTPVKRRNLAETIGVVLGDLPELESIDDDEIKYEPPPFRREEKIPKPGKPDGPLILVAEDNPVNQKLLAMIIEKSGFQAIMASDGVEAIEMVKTYDPDLIFMDIQMPRMDGYMAAEKIRETKNSKPIIAVTAGVFADEQDKFQSAGINDILIKPFKQNDIKIMIQKWLKQPASGDDAEASGHAPVNADPGNEIFNIEDFNGSFMGNDEIAFSLLQRFLDRTGGQIGKILVHLEAGEWDIAKREAHTIKGAARTMGGRDLGRAAADVELVCKSREKEEIQVVHSTLKDAFDKFKISAEKHISELSSEKARE